MFTEEQKEITYKICVGVDNIQTAHVVAHILNRRWPNISFRAEEQNGGNYDVEASPDNERAIDPRTLDLIREGCSVVKMTAELFEGRN
jgi:hypothetical protein